MFHGAIEQLTITPALVWGVEAELRQQLSQAKQVWGVVPNVMASGRFRNHS